MLVGGWNGLQHVVKHLLDHGGTWTSITTKVRQPASMWRADSERRGDGVVASGGEGPLGAGEVAAG